MSHQPESLSIPHLELKPFTSYQKFIIAVLSFLQFTIILDFMIMSPLGAILMPALHISPSQFGLVVSAYAFSAGASGFLAAGFADRYDRKKLLLFFYIGFVVGTLCCAMSPTFEFLLFSRIVTGIFGGVIGAVVLAITTDIFSFNQRGRVMGAIQSSFAASQILGIPAGLFFANHWGWHAPFLMIVGVSSVVGVVIFMFIKPIDGHLKKHPDKNPLHHLYTTVTEKKYRLAFLTTALLSLGGYMLMPFGSAFSVHNLGIPMEKLPMVYLVTGIAAMFIGPLVGRLSDSFGKFNMFISGSLLTIIMVIIYTNLGITPILVVMLVNVMMFMGIFSRMIPAQALTSAIPTPENRGAFMAVSSSLQQVAGGFASVVSGMIVVQNSDGVLEHFDRLGYVLAGTTLVSIMLMRKIHKQVPEKIK